LDKVTIYTDGSCKRNPGKGGYAAILLGRGYERILTGGFLHTTNNRMELMAAIVGLTALESPSEVTLYSDSQYLVRTMTSGWKRNTNHDLWAELDALCAKHNVKFVWVRGHSGNEYNDRCDRYANEAALAAKEVDSGYRI
jgi:ribonuclease HI